MKREPRTLRIDGKTLRPGDNYELTVSLAAGNGRSKLTASLVVTFHWDGKVLRRTAGP